MQGFEVSYGKNTFWFCSLKCAEVGNVRVEDGHYVTEQEYPAEERCLNCAVHLNDTTRAKASYTETRISTEGIASMKVALVLISEVSNYWLPKLEAHPTVDVKTMAIAEGVRRMGEHARSGLRAGGR